MDGDLAEDGLEGIGSRAPALDPVSAFAVTTLEDQLLIGLLDEDAEEFALDFEAGWVDSGLDLAGEMLIPMGNGPGQLEREPERGPDPSG